MKNAIPTRIVQFVPHLAEQRFFTAPKLGRTIDETEVKAHLSHYWELFREVLPQTMGLSPIVH
ncbi:MAG: hypothetical protein BroJett018_36410 [Chloroflexota bacterium]|nr:hypothetical protein [Chloroflexota bacterium]GIK65847.1 MAG: hypothetical protein BroJett018_36410 [Chloroflexota bacterium]